MGTIEIRIQRDSREVGYLRLEWSRSRGYFVDMIDVSRDFRRQGIGSALMAAAVDLLGYAPEPEAILPNPAAQAFWNVRGYSAGFNQAKLEC